MAPSNRIAVASIVFLMMACNRDEQSAQGVNNGDPAPTSQRFVGCIGPTAEEHLFVLSVAEGRDFTTGEPPGTLIPRKSELPEDAPPPIPRRTVTSGTPGGGPTPTTKIVTYTLIGDGGKDLRNYLGHTVEVVGRAGEKSNQSSTEKRPSPPLYVTSITDLAAYCK